ncbi:MAG: SGNH/GDSL hydrolase family protein [Bdellovibrionales bacterium]|nr:SGNH/GDSL hydrolase family protein [Bdellovibrionales bacterium]
MIHSNVLKFDSLLGWSQKESFQDRFQGPEFSIQVSTNQYGMRDNFYLTQKQKPKRMLVLGDSFAWGWGVEQEDIFSEILEKKHPEWEILNTAVPGYGTDQELLALQVKWKEFKPDIILLLFCGNDLINNVNSSQYYMNKPLYRLQMDHLVAPQGNVPPASAHQSVFRFLARHMILLKEILVGIERPINKFLDTRIPKSEKIKITLKLLEKINSESNAMGAQFILVSVPMRKVFRDSLSIAAERKGHLYMPLDEAFSNTATQFLFEDGHWNKAGHVIAAKAIDKFFMENDVWR